ncbi:MAG TPA: hypothetical protein DD670_07680 [Planctomycetaceae bacterium]|nr:hypothetical protein [Planctomycetaceae bacterium]
MKIHSTNGPTPARRGFTLVELLTVIVIISILAGLVTVAALSAIKGAKRATISSEITQLSMALQKYKDERGDYPPDFCGLNTTVYPTAVVTNMQTAILRHLRRAFPKYTPGVTTTSPKLTGWAGFQADVFAGSGNTLDVNNMTPDAALVFWLGGMPDTAGSAKLNSFSANPANPFALGGTRLPAYFEFDEVRLTRDATTNTYRYVPPHVTSPDGAVGAENVAPYVYFQARSKEYLIRRAAPAAAWIKTYQPTSIPGVGTACPYARENATPADFATVKWFEPEKFQIICCGLDGIYLNPAATIVATNPAHVRYVAEEQNNLTTEEDDNQASFTQGSLGDWSEGK